MPGKPLTKELVESHVYREGRNKYLACSYFAMVVMTCSLALLGKKAHKLLSNILSQITHFAKE